MSGIVILQPPSLFPITGWVFSSNTMFLICHDFKILEVGLQMSRASPLQWDKAFCFNWSFKTTGRHRVFNSIQALFVEFISQRASLCVWLPVINII